MNPTYMLLLTYRPPPDVTARGYEPWLCEHDNPFFNAIPGIRRYENWKVVRADGDPGFTHFDFLEVAEEDLERVWFNDDLTRFREGWVKRWGYGGDGAAPSALNAYGYLFKGGAAPRSRHITVSALRDAGAEASNVWRLAGALRKHYAIGPAPTGQPWRHDADAVSWLDFWGLRIEDGATPLCGRPSTGTTFVAVATLIAAPGAETD